MDACTAPLLEKATNLAADIFMGNDNYVSKSNNDGATDINDLDEGGNYPSTPLDRRYLKSKLFIFDMYYFYL